MIYCASQLLSWLQGTKGAGSIIMTDGGIKEVQIIYRLFLVNCYLLHVSRLPSLLASSRRGWVIDFIWLELP